MRKVLEKLTYANVVATLALFVALGGGGYAVAGKKKVVERVTSAKIKDGHVTARDLASVRIVEAGTNFGAAYALCGKNEQVLGGGGRAFGGSLGGSEPITLDGVTGWSVGHAGLNYTGPTRAVALCLSSRPGKRTAPTEPGS